MTVKAKLVLGIETSCDETGVALYDTIEGLKGHKLYSQVKLHARYGGVGGSWGVLCWAVLFCVVIDGGE